MKLPLITATFLFTFLFPSLVLSRWPPSEWPENRPDKEGLDVPEPGGNWKSGPQCMTPRPYYVGYGRYEPAMAQANCISTKLDDAWIIGPHSIDTISCKYMTNIFLSNDNDFNVTVPFPVLGQVAIEIVRECSDHRSYVNGEEDFIIWGKKLTIIIAWRDCPGDPDW